MAERAALVTATLALLLALGSAGSALADPPPLPASPTPLVSPTLTAAPTPRPLEIETPTVTSAPTPTAIPTPSPTPTAIPTPSPTPSPAAKPRPSATPQPAPRRTSPTSAPERIDVSPADRTDMLFGPVWLCLTFDGTKLKHFYKRGDGGAAISVTTQYQLPGRAATQTHENYRFQPHTGLWIASVGQSTIVAQAPPWIGDTWSFDGTSFDRGRRVGVRMIYSYLGPDAFRRDFERANDFGSYDVYAGETCRRTRISD